MCALRTVKLLSVIVGRRFVDGTKCRGRSIRDFCSCTVIVAVSVVSRVFEFVASVVWSRRNVVGFEFAFSGKWQGYSCDARFGKMYRPPWYMFGSLEPREEMANAGEKPKCDPEGKPDDTPAEAG